MQQLVQPNRSELVKNETIVVETTRSYIDGGMEQLYAWIVMEPLQFALVGGSLVFVALVVYVYKNQVHSKEILVIMFKKFKFRSKKDAIDNAKDSEMQQRYKRVLSRECILSQVARLLYDTECEKHHIQSHSQEFPKR